MQLFYNQTIHSENTVFTFDKIESKHIVKVLRKKEGDLLYITDGNNQLFTAKITFANDKKCEVSIINIEQKKRQRDYYLHIAIAPTKNIDRLEWFLEKATEIGIDEITPIICNHSERKLIKPERLEKVLISAMKQSLKFLLPKLNNLMSFDEFVQKNNEANKFIAHCYESDKKSFKQSIHKQERILVLIGPEGDFNPKEIELALANNFTPVTLGESRLRTETAGIVAVHSVAFANE